MYLRYLFFIWMFVYSASGHLTSEQATHYAIDRTYYYAHSEESESKNAIMLGTYITLYSGTGEPKLSITTDNIVSLYLQNKRVELSPQESIDLLRGRLVFINGQNLQMFRPLGHGEPLQVIIYTEDLKLHSITFYIQSLSSDKQ